MLRSPFIFLILYSMIAFNISNWISYFWWIQLFLYRKWVPLTCERHTAPWMRRLNSGCLDRWQNPKHGRHSIYSLLIAPVLHLVYTWSWFHISSRTIAYSHAFSSCQSSSRFYLAPFWICSSIRPRFFRRNILGLCILVSLPLDRIRKSGSCLYLRQILWGHRRISTHHLIHPILSLVASYFFLNTCSMLAFSCWDPLRHTKE